MSTKDSKESPSYEEIHKRITVLLEVYPVISPSMMNIGLGPATVTTGEWKPVFQDMIANGEIVQWEDLHARAVGDSKFWKKISLRSTYEELKSSEARLGHHETEDDTDE